MNSAARVLHQHALSRIGVLPFVLTNMHYLLFTLSLGILISALSVIYVTNMTRDLNARLQQSFVERDQLHVQWGQLLLEKSTWMTQGRIQQIASKKLEMVVPVSKSVVIVKE